MQRLAYDVQRLQYRIDELHPDEPVPRGLISTMLSLMVEMAERIDKLEEERATREREARSPFRGFNRF